VAQHHPLQVNLILIDDGLPQHGTQVSGIKAELLQVLVVIINDLRHELIEANKGAEVFFKDIQPILLLLTRLKAVLGIGN